VAIVTVDTNLRGEDSTATLEAALAHAGRLLRASPSLALEQAEEILAVAPAHPGALLIQAVALRALGRAREALIVLQPLCSAQPHWAQARCELGVTLLAAGDASGLGVLEAAARLDPRRGETWLALADARRELGDEAGADLAYAQHIRAATNDSQLMHAAAALCDGRLGVAEGLLKDRLKTHPTDVATMRMLAEVAARLARYGDAEALLSRALELAPKFTPARHNLAIVLHRQNKPEAALAQIDHLLTQDPHNPGFLNLKAAILARIGDVDTAIKLYADLLGAYPNNPKVWMSSGHALKTAAKTDQAINAYRRAIALNADLGEAYWSLANLKTFAFTDEDVAAMQARLAAPALGDEDRLHFHFALGKALEDRAAYGESFAHYQAGASLRRAQVEFDADAVSALVARSKALFTAQYFQARKGWGAQADDPIFVLGLPRAGSTLVEQILASHSLVEGTQELPDIIAIAGELGERRRRDEESPYPQSIGALDAARAQELGEAYLSRTRIHRKLGRPFFIDKMPNNFLHLGLILTLLPNAKIIDARRHPMACCFSAFKQHFARGQSFSYALDDLSRYYRDYVALMAHFDAVAPGRVHRVIYERMVEDTQTQVRALLAYCGLPFEEACLRPHETARAVRTASSEQVRRPIYQEGLDHWKNYEPWLEPLARGLGDVLETYPDVPPR
jgi:tetratricopeptide (TPR) repeat protein